MRGWIESAYEEIDEQLECGEISSEEYKELARGINAEAEQEADELRGEYLYY